MSKRHRDAIQIQQGACNPVAISRALVSAIDEARAENLDTDGICADPAVRLICHQLAFLLKTENINDSITEYDHLLTECERVEVAA